MGDLVSIATRAECPSRDILRFGLVQSTPELTAMSGAPQDRRWHPEGDVLSHSLLAADAAVCVLSSGDYSPARRVVVVLAALLHDVGKPDTTHLKGGRWTAYGHAEHGAALTQRMGARLSWPRDLQEPVGVLVATHMAVASVRGEPSARAVRRLSQRLECSGSSLIEWAAVVEADGAARGEGSVTGRSLPWLRVSAQAGGS